MGQRDSALDLIKAICIASMIYGHIAAGSTTSNLLHAIPKFDGASGFILVSGLVLGIVQRRRYDRGAQVSGLRSVSLKRAAQIYLLQVALASFALITIEEPWSGMFLDAGVVESPPALLVGILSMGIAPPGGDVLRLYVVFLLLAAVAYVPLVSGRWRLVLLISMGLAMVGYLLPSETSFTPFGPSRSASWASWQMLFIVALVIGWHWSSNRVEELITKRALVFGSISVGIILLAAWSVLADVGSWIFDKYSFAPGRILVAFAVCLLLYLGIKSLAYRSLGSKSTYRFLIFFASPLERTGVFALDAYVMQSVATTVFVGYLGLQTSDWHGVAAATFTFAAIVLWAQWRFKAKIVKRPITTSDDRKE